VGAAEQDLADAVNGGKHVDGSNGRCHGVVSGEQILIVNVV